MKVPLSWLKEYVSIEMPPKELAERLALTGTEVERVARVGVSADGGNLDFFVVGQVKTVSPHPNADKLVLCDVDVGGEEKKIICGAKNFIEGDKVAVCLPGGTMPGGRKLKPVEIRGVASHGMLCSEAELGLESESPGIMVLPEDAAVGARLVDHIAVSDEVLELEVTPNRPDCLSIYGVAREVAAITDGKLGPEPTGDIEPQGHDSIDELVEISVKDGDLCPRYGARLVSGVKIAASPAWLKARIIAAGMRPVNNVVDITNYVMWTLGEPMHAFDLAKIAGRRLVVRRALEGEEITTIDGTIRNLTAEMLVIGDGDKPSAIAGIMGSEASEVSDDTTDILLEAANFAGPNVMATSMELGLRSDSSTRFEKGLDPELVSKALAMASRMIVEICGGRLVPGEIDIYEGKKPESVIHLKEDRIVGLLGLDVAPVDIKKILTSLDFEVQPEDGGMRVTVPSFRADVGRQVDLIEEIARIYGFDRIPPTLPSEMQVMGGLSPYQETERRIAVTLVDNGLNEVITYTFIAPDFADRLRLAKDDPRRGAVVLDNPLSIEQSVMRTIMLPSMLDTVSRNLALRNEDVNIFEQGRVYLPLDGKKLPDESRIVAGCLCGSLSGESWLKTERNVDYFTGKGIVEALLARLNSAFDARATDELFLHPGKSAAIYINDKPAGYVGEVHPHVLKAYEIEKTVVAFEIDQDVLIENSLGTILFEDLITYPASLQDIAVVVSKEATAAKLAAVVRDAGAPLLRSARVFDIYEGEQVGEGKKSIAMRLEFRSADRTLTDEDVDSVRGDIISALTEKLGAELRS